MDPTSSTVPPEPQSNSARPSVVSFSALRRRSRSGSRSHSVESTNRILLLDNTAGESVQQQPILRSEPEQLANSDTNGGEGSSTLVGTATEEERADKQGKREKIKEKIETRRYKEWSEQSMDKGKGKYRKKRKSTICEIIKNGAGVELEVAYDVLYENQRGSFFFGIPLFSSNALLNFDPSPWTNQFGKISFVSVDDAQLPDPSWRWDWKAWHVDMDHDVDDGGWTYSFSFSPIFSWHGHHIFFNSFVRRRRWIRRRVRYLEAGVALVEDDWSKVSNRRSTLYRIDSNGTFSPEEMEAIMELSTLMKTLRICRLDREKLDAVASFLEHGGQDRRYLPDKIPEIQSLLIFHESRRRLLDLISSANLPAPDTAAPTGIWALPRVISPLPLDDDLRTPTTPAFPARESYFPTTNTTANTLAPPSPALISPKTLPPAAASSSSSDPAPTPPTKDESESDSEQSEGLTMEELTWRGEDHVDDAAEEALGRAKKRGRRERIKRKSGLFKGKGKEKESGP